MFTTRRSRKQSTVRRRFRPRLDILEDRLAPAVISFSAASYSANENAGFAVITVVRSAITTQETVQYATTGGTASVGSLNPGQSIGDYLATSGTLTFAPGQSSKTFAIQIMEDVADDPNETINLALNTPGGGASLGAPSTAVLTLVDNPGFDPSARAQYMLELINRMRLNPQAELPLILPLAGQFGVDPTLLQQQWSSLAPVSPLAWHPALYNVAVAHNQLGYQLNSLMHQLPGEAPLSTRIQNAGYVLADESFPAVAENIVPGDSTVFHAHAGLAIDPGSGPGGMLNPPAHRNNIMNGTMREIGIGVLDNLNFGTLPLFITQDFSYRLPLSRDTYLMGVVYNDFNGNNLYDPGEGLGGVNVSITGPSSFNTTTMSAGGYQVVVPNGSYSLTFSGGGLTAPVTRNATVSGNNVKVDVQPIVPVPGTIRFSTDGYTVNEDVGNAVITVTRENGNSAVAISYSTSNGTATAGQDYTTTSGVLNFAAGQLTATFNIPIINDITPSEGNETVFLTLSTPTGGATLGYPRTAALTIVDNDVPTPGSFQFSASTFSVNENGGNATITVTRTSNNLPASVNYATSTPATATAGTDYTAVFATLNFTAGQTSATFIVPIVDDTIAEGNETVDVILTSPTGGASLGSPSRSTLTIVDNDAVQAGSFQFSTASPLVNETAGNATVTVTRTSNNVAAAVNYATSNGTAIAGSDYTTRSGTLSFTAGQTSATFTVPIFNDTLQEGNETVNLTLSSPTGGAGLGSPFAAVLTIIDDETPQGAISGAVFNDQNADGTRQGGEPGLQGWSVFLDQNGNGVRDSRNATFNSINVPLAIPEPAGTVSSNLTVNGVAGTITDVNVTLNITHTVDFQLTATLVSPVGTRITLFSQVGGSGQNFTNTMLDDQATTPIASGFAPFTGSYQPAQLLAGLNNQSLAGTWRLEINDGSVFPAASGVLNSWSLNITYQEAAVQTDASGAYTFLSLSPGTYTVREVLQAGWTQTGPAGGSYSVPLAAGQVVTDRNFGNAQPMPGQLQFSSSSYSFNEGGGSAVITVTRTNGSTPVSVNYAASNGTATAGLDYTATSGILNFTAGQTSATFSIPITNDSMVEEAETVNLALSNPTGGAALGSPATAILTITDNDVATPGSFQFSASIYSVNENGGGAVITVTRTSSNVPASVSYAFGGGTATAGQDYTAVSSILTFSAGQTSTTFSVPILDDTFYEGNETVNLTLSNPTGGATLGSPIGALLTIGDNDAAITSVTHSSFVINTGDALTLNVAFAGPAAVAHTATVDWGDSSTPTTLNLAAGVQTFSASHIYTMVGAFQLLVNATPTGGSGDTVTLHARAGAVAPPSGLVAWWTGNQGHPVIAPDSAGVNSGRLINGTFHGVGQVGNSFEFDGIDDHVRVNDAPSLRLTTTGTIQAWIFPTGEGMLVNKEGEYEIARFGTIHWAFANTNPGWNFVDTGYNAPLNQWTHLAVTYDNGVIRTYANGTLVHNYNGAGAIGDVDPSRNDFQIGARQAFPGTGNFLGRIDEVQLHNRALTAAEIQTVYNAGSAGQIAGVRVVTPTLQVTSFVTSRNGFSATFNQAIFASDLNLYDTQLTNFGPADVTVTGAVTGPVRGSLVVNAAANSITFINTGAQMPEDTYTVTLRSAANGFHTVGGGLLDGNADGTGGDPYTNIFTLTSTSQQIVSIPDFARGPGQPINVPGGSVGLPLSLNDGAGVNTVSLTLLYNPALLNITGAVVGSSVPAGASVNLDTGTAGQAVLTFNSPTALPAGAIDFVILTANVPDTAPYTAKHILDLTNQFVNGVGARGNDGIHVVAYFGDITGNAAYSASDAARALRVAVGLDSGFAAYQLADPRIIADINANGQVNATDATRILQESIGIDAAQIPPLPGVIPPIVPGGPDPFLNLPTDLVAKRGGLLTAPVLLDRSVGLEGAELAISFDPARLEVVDVQRGSLTDDFDLFAFNPGAGDGTLRVALSRSAGPIENRGSGSVLAITFRVREDAPAGPTILNLRRAIGNTMTLLNEGGLDLIPDPSDEAGDVLDGFVVVGRARELRPGVSEEERTRRSRIGRMLLTASEQDIVDLVLTTHQEPPVRMEPLSDPVDNSSLLRKRNSREGWSGLSLLGEEVSSAREAMKADVLGSLIDATFMHFLASEGR